MRTIRRRKLGEYSDRLEAITQGGEEGVHVSLERCRRGRRWRAEGNKTAEGRDGRNRRNLCPGGSTPRQNRLSIHYLGLGRGEGGEERREEGKKVARARKSGNGARTRREDPKWTSFPAELGFSGPRFPLNAHATQRGLVISRRAALHSFPPLETM